MGILNPNCDMDLDVYKDWLYEFNNNDDLRDIDFASFVSGLYHPRNCHQYWGIYYYGIGEGVIGGEEWWVGDFTIDDIFDDTYFDGCNSHGEGLELFINDMIFGTSDDYGDG